jgi:hypothetical protein
MSNTVTQRTVYGDASTKEVVRLITIISDGSEETDLVIYDNSTLFNKPTQGSVLEIECTGSSACQMLFEWDQNTDSPIAALDPGASPHMCYRRFGGVTNPNGTGATGDVLLTTTNLDSGDVVTILLTVRQG